MYFFSLFTFTLIAFSFSFQIQSDVVDPFILMIPKSLPFSSNNFPSISGGLNGDGASPMSWTNCGESNDLFKLEFLELIPDPPRRSAPLTVKLRGYLVEGLEEGVVGYEIKFGGFKLATGKLDGCDALKKESNLPQCPIEAGPIDVTHTVELPWPIPAGKYIIHVFGERSSDHKQIFCLNLDILIDR